MGHHWKLELLKQSKMARMTNMKKGRSKKKVTLSLLSFLITLSCIAFVMWQTTKCINRYIQKPQGTTLSIVSTARLPFPAITICGDYNGYQYNKKNFENCGYR